MMSDDLDELDAALRRAMAALDGEAPAGYFEALPERTLARLDDPAIGPAIGELPDEPGRLRAVQGRRPPVDDDEDDDGAVFSSQIMAAVELPEPADPELLPRSDRASASSWIAVRSVPAVEDAGAHPASAAPVPSSGAASGPVEVPASAASMASAGPPRHRPVRRMRVAIVGIGAIGLAAAAAIYLAAGDHDPRSASPIVSSGERSVTSGAAGSAASPQLGASGSAGTTPVGVGSAAAQGPGSGAGPETVGKLAGPPGKRPGKVKTVSKGSGGKPDAQRPTDELTKTGKKLKSSKPRSDRTLLSGEDIERAMTAVGGKARACFAGIRGTASLRVTIAPSGRIAQVAVTGPFAGTPTGACVERAVQAATFPPWDGAPQSFDYSYLLSD